MHSAVFLLASARNTAVAITEMTRHCVTQNGYRVGNAAIRFKIYCVFIIKIIC